MCNGCTYNYGKSERDFSTLHPYYIAQKKCKQEAYYFGLKEGSFEKDC